jgi:hypothetical protein
MFVTEPERGRTSVILRLNEHCGQSLTGKVSACLLVVIVVATFTSRHGHKCQHWYMSCLIQICDRLKYSEKGVRKFLLRLSPTVNRTCREQEVPHSIKTLQLGLQQMQERAEREAETVLVQKLCVDRHLSLPFALIL